MIPRQGTLGAAALVLLAIRPAWAQGGETRDSVPPPVPAPVVSPAPTMEIPPGPLSPGARLVFTRDSILWTNGYTLADLLVQVPGTYAARTGAAGQPTPVFYGGRGSAGIQIISDGLPLVALGPDSLAPDPGTISLIGLERVEVERHPSFLRVYLVSERTPQLGARSLLRIVNGDFKSAGYAGTFQYRWRSGLGVGVDADYFDGKGGQGPERDAKWFDLDATIDWTPTPLLSAVFETRAATLDRVATLSALGLRIPLRKDNRRESLLRLVASTRPDRQGWSVEAGFQNTRWRADSTTVDTILGERNVNRGFLGVRLAGFAGSADLEVRASDYHTPLEAEFRTGWTPGWIVLSGSARWARHTANRTSKVAEGSLGLYRGPFALVGDVRWADAVPVPVLETDTAQRTLDVGARAGFESRLVTLHAGLERQSAFTPPDFGGVPGFALEPSPEATIAVGDLTLNFGPMAVSGWYANPVAGEAASFEPPSHSRVALTFRSQFRRTFRSGAFDLKVQIALESWGAGTAGQTADGTPIPLPGTSVGEAFLQVELVGFHAFYSLQNALRSLEGFVPGFEYPRNRQSFGVKWLFRD